MTHRDWPPQPYLPPGHKRVPAHHPAAIATVIGMTVAVFTLPAAGLAQATQGLGEPVLISGWAVAWLLVIGGIVGLVRAEEADRG